MNKKRTITIRHPQLVRFRNALREVLSLATVEKSSKLIGECKHLSIETDFERIKFLSDKRDKLDTAWKKSICTCPSCGSRTSDMTFNPNGKYWFCAACYQEKHDFYRKKVQEGEIWSDGSGEPSTKWYP